MYVAPPPPPASATSRPPLPTVKSHQSGRIEEHWNDLPATFLSTSSSKNSSRSVSPMRGTPAGATILAATTAAAADFEPLLDRLFSAPSRLPPAQLAQLRAAVLRNNIVDAHKAEVAGMLAAVLERALTPAEGKRELVAFMMREQAREGIVGWVPKVRQGVENVLLEG